VRKYGIFLIVHIFYCILSCGLASQSQLPAASSLMPYLIISIIVFSMPPSS
jgi:hypothetical protein